MLSRIKNYKIIGIAITSILAIGILFLLILANSTITGNYSESALAKEAAVLPIPSNCVSDRSPLYIKGNISNRSEYNTHYACVSALGVATQQINDKIMSLNYGEDPTFPEPIYTQYNNEVSLYIESNQFRARYTIRLDDTDLPKKMSDLPDSARVVSISLNLKAK